MRVIPILNLIPTLLSKWCYISHENKRKRNPKRARAMVMVFRPHSTIFQLYCGGQF
jgi:hypothetical protein